MNIRQMALASVALLAIPAAFAAQNIDRSQATGPAPSVEINNVQGRVTVVAWDRQEVKVTGTIGNDEDEFEFSGDPERVVITVRTKSKKHSGGRQDDALLDVRVPAGAALNVQTVSADIEARGVRGAQRLEAVSGDVVTEVFDEQLDLRTISGDARVRGSGGKAKLYVESTSGDVTGRGLGGGVEAKSVSGDLDFEIGSTPQVRLETVSGDLSARLTLADAARLDARSVSGDLRLTFGKPVNAEFDVETFSGDIDSCFGPKPGRKSKYGPGSELRFTEGSGSARVSLETMSGAIGLCDH
jgi:DUF4097 and DUF4098 domain-containing protein YvlB